MSARQSTVDCTYPKAFIRPCILLLLHEAPAHGHGLLKRLLAFGVELSDAGRVYRALRSMEQEGLVRPQWETKSRGPARRVYELTAEGRRALDDYETDLEALAERVLDFLGQLRRLRLRCGPNDQRAYEVLVETKLSVEASDEASARDAVERAFAKPWPLDQDVRSKGPVWVYEATIEADA